MKTKGLDNPFEICAPAWFPVHLMRTSTTTAFATTVATATVTAYAPAVAMHAFSMWSSPTVKHANKRSTRWPSGVVN